MTFTHYAPMPIPALRPVTYQQRVADKPSGLWLSVDGKQDWLEWCEQESFGIGRCPHRVTLNRDADILKLRTVKDIDAFTQRFGRNAWGKVIASSALLGAVYHVNWSRVAKSYQGIIIAPYQWDRRHSRQTFWYYGWDCASGCVWDLSVINSWEPLGDGSTPASPKRPSLMRDSTSCL